MIINIEGNEIVNCSALDMNLTYIVALTLHPLFTDKKILIVDNQTVLEEILKAAIKFQVDCILIENCSHACYIPNISYTTPIPLFHLSSNMEYFNSEVDHVLFFPYWLMGIKTFPLNNITIGSELDLNRKFNICSANRNLKHRPHRIYFLAKLLQKSYLDNVCLRMYKYDDFDLNFKDYNSGLLYEEWILVKDRYDRSPYFTEMEINAVIDTNFDIYTDGYVNVVCETYDVYNFLSEKSYKPLIAGQIPIILGYPGIMKMFADLGFDMFYDIIDHNYYDFIVDTKDRTHAMLKILDYVNCLPLGEIFKNTIGRRQKNLERIHSQELFQMITNPIVKKIGSLI